MALTKIKGRNFRAFIGGAAAAATAVVEETSMSAQIQGNLEDATTKDTEGSYSEQSMTSKQWQIQVDNLNATAASLKALITQFNSDSPVTVGFDQTTTTAGSMNRTPANADFARSGQAYLTSLQISAPNRQNISISSTYQGTGALA